MKHRLPSRLPTTAAGIAEMARTGVVPSMAWLSLPCIHGGTDADILERCETCSGGARHVRECDIHPSGVTWEPIGTLPDCQTCRRENGGFVGVGSHPNIIAADAFRRSLAPYPEGRYAGRGIVICGGGKYWPSVYVTVRMIRHVGCTLPVQVWYLGEMERDDRFAALVRPFGVEVVDMLAHPEASKTRGLTGFNGGAPFESKSFAVLHSPFAEVLSLDADCYPCVDPSGLFDEPRYRATGGVFWPDRPSCETWTRWEQWGVPKFGPNCGWEVGQYLIDKRTAWGPLNMARWYDDHGDWCYGGNRHHDHGDKGPWRVGWAAFRRSPAIYFTGDTWNQIAYVQPGPDGRTPAFIHRCGSKFSLSQTNFVTAQSGYNLRVGLPGDAAAFGYLDELQKTLYTSRF